MLFYSELEGLANGKNKKNRARTKLREGYEAELAKLKEELSIVANENAEIKGERDAKKEKIEDMQSEIKEMRTLLQNLTAAREGLNKYVDSPKYLGKIIGIERNWAMIGKEKRFRKVEHTLKRRSWMSLQKNRRHGQ